VLTGNIYAQQSLIILEGTLYNQNKSALIFDQLIRLSENKPIKVFTGAHTLIINYEAKENEQYGFQIEILGLGPEYKRFNYDFELGINGIMLIPEVPVKNKIRVKYQIGLRSGQGQWSQDQYSLDSTKFWGNSETIHYHTYFVHRTLMDFRWNLEMGYLENIYDRYRQSFSLSSSDKIKTNIHPESPQEVFVYGDVNYSILPHDHRIDLVYNKEIDGATPAAAAELLVYEQWGYGPAWMARGFARYYDDCRLQLRKYIPGLTVEQALNLLNNESYWKKDKALNFTGAFVFYLLQNYSQAAFRNLYMNSTVLDYDILFKKYYKVDFNEVLEQFLNDMKKIELEPGELDYYATNYFKFGPLSRAKEYLIELVATDTTNLERNLGSLAICNYWAGLYEKADKNYDTLINKFGRSSMVLVPKGDVQMALGNFDAGIELYTEAYAMGSGVAANRLASYYIENDMIDSSRAILANYKPNSISQVDYLLNLSEIKLIEDENPDSLLNQAMNLALGILNQAPHDPNSHYDVAKAHMLLGEYEKAIEFIDMAWQVEENPDQLGEIILLTGKIDDLNDNRNYAVEGYNEILKINAGEYYKSLAKKYLKSPYKLKTNRD
jgi:hypothetical protein